MRHRILCGVVGAVVGLAVVSAQGEVPKFSLHDMGKSNTSSNGQTSLADVDKDGDLDFVSGCRPGPIHWWEYRGPDEWVKHVVGTNVPTDVGGVLLDVDGDGWLDQCSGAAWWKNTGRPREEQFTRHENGVISNHDMRVADVDGDGKLDVLALGEASGVFWYRIPKVPTGKWDGVRIGDCRHSGLGAGDLDGDKDIDVVASNYWYENADGKGTQWTRHENIPFEGTRYNRFGMSTQCQVADLDGDGDADLAMTDGETDKAKLAWMENVDGKGRQWKRHDLADGKGALHSLAVADFNNDGKLDVFTCEMEIGGTGSWFVFENDGKGKFAGTMILTGVAGHETRAGDVDGDGDVDLCSKPWRTDRHVFVRNMLK